MNKVAYTLAGQAKSARVLFTGAALIAALGCSAGVKPNPTGAGGKGGITGPGTAGTSGLRHGRDGLRRLDAAHRRHRRHRHQPGRGMGCQHDAVHLRPEDPDRLPGGRPVGQHVPLPQRDPVRLPQQGGHVVVHAQGRHRVGDHAARRRRSASGSRPSSAPIPANNRGGMCPLITGTLADNVAPALNNASRHQGEIRQPRRGRSRANPRRSGKKFESPAMYAITAATKALMADTDAG